MGRAVPLPVLPYDPLRPLPDDHPPPIADSNFVHPLAKWDSFLDIPEDPSTPHEVSNDPPIIPQRFPASGSASDDKAIQRALLEKMTGLTSTEMQGLYKFTVLTNRVSNQTRKGKTSSLFVLTVVGNPERGLLGLGQAKNANSAKARDLSYADALKNMDTVCRYQDRTIWGAGEDMKIKYRATRIHMRARPPGFGLRCAPMLHHVFTACGIKDVSAKIHGSHNPASIVKGLVHHLQGGRKQIGLGNGIGGKGLSTDKGMGLRSVEELQIERGRYTVEVGNKYWKV